MRVPRLLAILMTASSVAVAQEPIVRVDPRVEFMAFFAAHHPLYDSAETRLRRVVNAADLAWFGQFYGTNPDAHYYVVPLLANSGTNLGASADVPGGREVYAILGHEHHDAAGFP